MEKILKQILSGLKDVKKDITEFKTEMHDFKDEMIEFKTETTKRLDELEIGQRENRNILRSLEHASEVSKAQRDRFTHDIKEIKGDIKDMKKDITKIEFVASSNWNEIIKLKATK
ncbi:MAG: hypothetical protein FH751_15440 [Firmicutes bacterium]|nr:hypothetical protein [Bacillota bacterium]